MLMKVFHRALKAAVLAQHNTSVGLSGSSDCLKPHNDPTLLYLSYCCYSLPKKMYKHKSGCISEAAYF